jgi:hypothetical protein
MKKYKKIFGKYGTIAYFLLGSEKGMTLLGEIVYLDRSHIGGDRLCWIDGCWEEVQQ